MFSHQLNEAMTSLRGRRPKLGSAAGSASQLASLLASLTDRSIGGMKQNLHWAASLFTKLRTAIHSQGSPTKEAIYAIRVIEDAIEGAQKALGREDASSSAKVARGGAGAAKQLWNLGKAGKLWKVNESGEVPDFWVELVELRDLSKEIYTSRRSYRDPTAAQRRALRTPGVASPKASVYHAPGVQKPSKYQMVHPSKLGHGALVMYKGRPHTVIGRKGKKISLRSPEGKTIAVDLSMDPGYEGYMGRGEDIEYDPWAAAIAG